MFVFVFVFVFLNFNVYKTIMSGLDPIPEENLVWDYYYKLFYDDDEFVLPENQNYIYTTPMAEGGYDPMDATTEKIPLIPDTGDDDDDTDPWKNIDLNQIPITGDTDSTQPFEPGAASTPAGEKVPMATRTRLPKEQGPRTAETSFIEGWDSYTGSEKLATKEVNYEFPNMLYDKGEARFISKESKERGGLGKRIEVKMRNSTTWYPLETKSKRDTEMSFNKNLPKGIKKALGPPRVVQITVTKQALSRNQNELAAKRKQLEQVEQSAAEAQKLRRDLDALRNIINDDDDRIRELEEAHGPLDTERIQRLKDEKRALESDHQSKRQQLSQLQKNAKQADKIQKDIDKLMLDNRRQTEHLDELRTKVDAILPLDELKQNKEELETKIAEDKRVIEDEATSSSEKIEVRERQRPLLERVKEIFKKYGWNLQAVVLAVGVVLSALALAGLNGLKAGTKAEGKGLKTIGQKLGSLLPGLTGSIVSFIFKAAGQVLSFLGEHAWLLILAVVAFFMERLLKKRRTQ